MTFTNPRAVDAGRYALDLFERVASTFVITFLGVLVSGGWFDVAQIRDLGAVKAAALAGVAAMLSLIKGLIAKFVANRSSASLAPGV
jgi:Putative lactococcus lactis phage r1t holin